MRVGEYAGASSLTDIKFYTNYFIFSPLGLPRPGCSSNSCNIVVAAAMAAAPMAAAARAMTTATAGNDKGYKGNRDGDDEDNEGDKNGCKRARTKVGADGQ